MKNIKISSTTLLVLFGLFLELQDIITGELVALYILLSSCLFIFLNIEAFKIKGIIKKLVIDIDVFLVIMIIAVFLPEEGRGSYIIRNVSIDLILLVIAGLLVAILVNAYKKPKIDDISLK